jgi:hypothetical protein
MVVEQTASGRYLIFWRAKCLKTGVERKFKTAAEWFPSSFDVWRTFVAQSFRDLELIEFRPWSTAEDGHRVLFPVPVQHVMFGVLTPDLFVPEPRRHSLLIQASRLLKPSLLKGAHHGSNHW